MKINEALTHVAKVKTVPSPLTLKSCHHLDGDDPHGVTHGDDNAIEVTCRRHAIINFPHPLLQQGLVVLDTPGLNAIGAEPELTLNLLPSAHAVLFLLAADAGVTRTDLEVWQRHLAGEDPAANAGRLVILNKIDG